MHVLLQIIPELKCTGYCPKKILQNYPEKESKNYKCKLMTMGKIHTCANKEIKSLSQPESFLTKEYHQAMREFISDKRNI
uniref:Uncharacterized protein n=1 Tax=Rhizophora mucronata TaxID=61149 RepID=A0A2P2LZL6_RHIMU